MKYRQPITTGVLIGAISWACSGWFTDHYEPYDSLLGFVISQLLLTSFAVYYGYQRGGKWLLSLYLLAAYIGLNVYSYLFATTAARNWFELGLITSLTLLMVPLLLGLITKTVNHK